MKLKRKYISIILIIFVSLLAFNSFGLAETDDVTIKQTLADEIYPNDSEGQNYEVKVTNDSGEEMDSLSLAWTLPVGFKDIKSDDINGIIINDSNGKKIGSINSNNYIFANNSISFSEDKINNIPLAAGNSIVIAYNLATDAKLTKDDTEKNLKIKFNYDKENESGLSVDDSQNLNNKILEGELDISLSLDPQPQYRGGKFIVTAKIENVGEGKLFDSKLTPAQSSGFKDLTFVSGDNNQTDWVDSSYKISELAAEESHSLKYSYVVKDNTDFDKLDLIAKNDVLDKITESANFRFKPRKPFIEMEPTIIDKDGNSANNATINFDTSDEININVANTSDGEGPARGLKIKSNIPSDYEVTELSDGWSYTNGSFTYDNGDFPSDGNEDISFKLESTDPLNQSDEGIITLQAEYEDDEDNKYNRPFENFDYDVINIPTIDIESKAILGDNVEHGDTDRLYLGDKISYTYEVSLTELEKYDKNEDIKVEITKDDKRLIKDNIDVSEIAGSFDSDDMIWTLKPSDLENGSQSITLDFKTTDKLNLAKEKVRTKAKVTGTLDTNDEDSNPVKIDDNTANYFYLQSRYKEAKLGEQTKDIDNLPDEGSFDYTQTDNKHRVDYVVSYSFDDSSAGTWTGSTIVDEMNEEQKYNGGSVQYSISQEDDWEDIPDSKWDDTSNFKKIANGLEFDLGFLANSDNFDSDKVKNKNVHFKYTLEVTKDKDIDSWTNLYLNGVGDEDGTTEFNQAVRVPVSGAKAGVDIKVQKDGSEADDIDRGEKVDLKIDLKKKPWMIKDMKVRVDISGFTYGDYSNIENHISTDFDITVNPNISYDNNNDEIVLDFSGSEFRDEGRVDDNTKMKNFGTITLKNILKDCEGDYIAGATIEYKNGLGKSKSASDKSKEPTIKRKSDLIISAVNPIIVTENKVSWTLDVTNTDIGTARNVEFIGNFGEVFKYKSSSITGVSNDSPELEDENNSNKKTKATWDLGKITSGNTKSITITANITDADERDKDYEKAFSSGVKWYTEKINEGTENEKRFVCGTEGGDDNYFPKFIEPVKPDDLRVENKLVSSDNDGEKLNICSAGRLKIIIDNTGETTNYDLKVNQDLKIDSNLKAGIKFDKSKDIEINYTNKDKDGTTIGSDGIVDSDGNLTFDSDKIDELSSIEPGEKITISFGIKTNSTFNDKNKVQPTINWNPPSKYKQTDSERDSSNEGRKYAIPRIRPKINLDLKGRNETIGEEGFVDNPAAMAGKDNVLWKIEIENVGEGKAKNLRINSDYLKDNDLYSDKDLTTKVDNNSNSDYWEIEELGAGKTATYYLKAKVSEKSDETETVKADASWGCDNDKRLTEPGKSNDESKLKTKPDISFEHSSKDLTRKDGTITITMTNDGAPIYNLDFGYNLSDRYKLLGDSNIRYKIKGVSIGDDSFNWKKSSIKSEPSSKTSLKELNWEINNGTNDNPIAAGTYEITFDVVHNGEELANDPDPIPGKIIDLNYDDIDTSDKNIKLENNLTPDYVELSIEMTPEKQVISDLEKDVVWTIKVTNDGNDEFNPAKNTDAINTTVEQTLGNGFNNNKITYELNSYKGDGSNQNNFTSKDGTLTWTGLKIPAGGTKEIKVKTKMKADGSHTNTVQAKEISTYTVDVESDANTEAYTAAFNLTKKLLKKDNTEHPESGYFTPGEIVEYEVTAKLLGNVEYKNLTIKDKLPDGLKYDNSDDSITDYQSSTPKLSFQDPTEGTKGNVEWAGTIGSNKQEAVINYKLRVVKEGVERTNEIKNTAKASFGLEFDGNSNVSFGSSDKDIENKEALEDTANFTFQEPELTITREKDVQKIDSRTFSSVDSTKKVRHTITVTNGSSNDDHSAAYETKIVESIPEEFKENNPIIETDEISLKIIGSEDNVKTELTKKEHYSIKYSEDTNKGELIFTLNKDTKINPGEDLKIKYTAFTNEDIKAGENQVFTANIAEYYSQPKDINYRENYPEDDLKATVEFNTEDSELTVSATPNDVTPGDKITYTVDFTIPANTTINDFALEAELPQGIEFIPDSFSGPGDGLGTWEPEVSGNAEKDNGQTLKFNNKTTVQHNVNKTYTLTFEGRVLDIEEVERGNDNNLETNVKYGYNGNGYDENNFNNGFIEDYKTKYSDLIQKVDFTIVEPALEGELSRENLNNDRGKDEKPQAGDKLKYTLEITSKSDGDRTTAYDVGLKSEFSKVLDYVDGSVKIVDPKDGNSIDNTVSTDNNTLKWPPYKTGDNKTKIDIKTDETVTVSFKVKVTEAVKPNQELNNKMTIKWSTQDGDKDENDRQRDSKSDPYGDKYNTTVNNNVNSEDKINIGINSDSKRSEIGDDKYRIGDIVEYTITVGDIMKGTIPGFKVEAILPDGLEFYNTGDIKIDSDNITIDGKYKNPNDETTGSHTWNFGEIENDPNKDNNTIEIKFLTLVTKDIENIGDLTTETNLSYEKADGGEIDSKPKDDDTVTSVIPDLTMEKTTDFEGKLSAEDEVEFTLTVKNNGSAPAYDMVIKDNIPEGMRDDIENIKATIIKINDNENIEESLIPTVNKENDKITWDLDDDKDKKYTLNPDNTLVLKYTVKADNDLEAGKDLTTKLDELLYYSLDDDNIPEDSDKGNRKEFKLTKFNDVKLSSVEPKAVTLSGPETVPVGEEITYTLKIPEDAIKAEMNDLEVDLEFNLQKEMEFIDTKLNNNKINITNDTINNKENGLSTMNFKLDKIGVDEQAVIEITARAPKDSDIGKGNKTKLSAVVTWKEDSDALKDNHKLTITEPELEAAQTIADSPDSPVAGDEVTFNLNIKETNEGNASAAQDVKITATLAEGLEYVKDSLKIVGSDIKIKETSVDDGQRQKITWSLDSAITTGENLNLKYTVKLTDDVKPSQELTNEIKVDWKSVADADGDDKSYGRKYNLELDADVSSNAPINTPDTSSITKEVEDTTFESKDVRIGDIVTYKLSINLQKGTSTEFKVKDTLPDGMNYVDTVKEIDEDIEENSKLIRATNFKNNRDATVDDSTKITWNIGTITNNADEDQTFEIIYRAQVTDADAFKDHKSPTLENTATIDYDGIDESRDDTEDTAEINLKQPKLEITEFKIDNNDDTDKDKQVAPGDTVSYQITVENKGSVPAYDTKLGGLVSQGLRDAGIIEASIKIGGDEKTSMTPEIDDDGKIKWKLLSSDKNNEDYTIPVNEELVLNYEVTVDEKLPFEDIEKATIKADYYSFGKHDIPKANQAGEIFEAKSDDRRHYETKEKKTSIIQIKDAELNKDSLEHFKNTTGDAPTVILTPNGRTLKEIKPKKDGDKLKENVDYEVEELENGKQEITFTKDYLDKQDIGDIDLDFVMDYGKNPDLTIKINEYQSSVNPEEKADQRELSAGPYDEQDDNKKGKIIFTFKDQAGNKVTGEKVELSIPEEYKEDLNYDDFKYSLDEGDDKDWSDKIEDLNNELKTDNSGQVIVYVKNKKADENLRISAKMIIMNTEKVISGELTIVSAAANKLGFVKKPEDNFAGNEMAPVEVEVLDEYGNRITDYTGKIDIAIGNNAGPDGNLNGTTKSVTVKDGIAKFDDLSIDKSGRAYTFEATSDGLKETESDDFNIKENISISAEDKNKITSNPQPSISGRVDDLESGNDAKITIKDDEDKVVFEGETTVGEDGDWEIKSENVPELTDGDYTVEAKITDENDNKSIDQGTLRIITTEPELSTDLKGEHVIRRPEDKTSYTLDIENIGETEVKDLTITTPIPAGFELNQDTIKVDGKELKKEEFELRDGNLIIEKDELAKDNTVTIKFAGQISSSGSEVAAGSIISTKSKIVYNDPLDNIYQLDSNMVKLEIETANGIKIKPVRFKAGQPDSQLVFAHTIVNKGNSLEKVVVSLDGLDRYDISWYYDQNSDGKLNDGDQLITDSKRKDIKINSLSAGGQQDILLVVDIPADAVKTEKTFAIKINSTLNNLDDQVKDKLTVIDNAPKLNLYDKDNKDLVYAGGRYQLEVEYGNQGEDILSDSTLEIPIPDEIDASNSDLTNNTDNSSYDENSNTITVEVADLDPSEERSFSLDLKVKDGIEQGTEIKTEVNFIQNGSPILKEDHSITVAEKIASKIELEAEPEIIKGDKKEISILTASLKDLLGSPVDGEVDLEFEVNTKKLERDYEIILEEDNDYETEIKSDDLTAKITTKSGEAKIKLKAEIKSDDIVEIPVDVTAKNEDAGLAKQRVYIVLSKGMLVGRIIDSSSNLPEVGLKVELKSDEEETKTTSTDKNGRYSFKVDENKDYEISIAEKEDGAGGFDIEVKIGKDEITNSPRAIEGKIYYEETKEPKEGAVIELYKPDGTFYGETTSNKNGRYNFEIDKTPNKKVKGRKNSSKQWTLKAPGSNLKKGVVDPKVGVTLLNANLSILGASNYGQVVNKNDNSPIEKADVTLKDSSNNQVLLPEINNAAQDNPYKSESDGKYIFKDVNPASYYVTVSKDGFYDYHSKLIDIATKNDIKDLNYRIEMEPINKDDLDIKKETEAEYTRPGEEVEYTITVQNNKDITISELIVDDILPSELVYVKDSANLAGSHSNGEINWKLNDLKPGKTELKYKVKVREDAEMGIKAVNEVEAELNGVIFKEKHELQISPPDLIINKTASEDRISIGDFISYKIEIQNDTGFDVDKFTLYDKIPAGFKYVEGSAVIIGENGAEDKLKTDAKRLLSYSDLNLASGDSLEIRYTLVVGTGVVTSNSYVNKAYAKFEKELISNIAKESVLVVKDPLFNTSTIIGKVYVDRNDDGMQTEGEKGLGGIDIISTSGQVVRTDEYGRFHFTIESDSNIQQAQTVVLKLKSDTLPDGATIRSNNPVIAKITSGVSLEVNFRIKIKD